MDVYITQCTQSFTSTFYLNSFDIVFAFLCLTQSIPMIRQLSVPICRFQNPKLFTTY